MPLPHRAKARSTANWRRMTGWTSGGSWLLERIKETCFFRATDDGSDDPASRAGAASDDVRPKTAPGVGALRRGLALGLVAFSALVFAVPTEAQTITVPSAPGVRSRRVSVITDAMAYAREVCVLGRFPRRGVAAVLLAAGLLGMTAPARAQTPTVPDAVPGDRKITAGSNELPSRRSLPGRRGIRGRAAGVRPAVGPDRDGQGPAHLACLRAGVPVPLRGSPAGVPGSRSAARADGADVPARASCEVSVERQYRRGFVVVPRLPCTSRMIRSRQNVDTASR